MSLEKFKTTKIGKIPKEWEMVRLGDSLHLIRNGLITSQNKDGKGFPVTRIETISEEKIDNQKVGFIEKVSEKELSEYKLQNGDILFSHINSLEHIGKTAIYEGNPPILLHGMNLLLLRPKNSMIQPYYLLYQLKHLRIISIFKNLSKKAVNQASINQKELGRIQLPLPPLLEQHKIAEILSTVDKGIEKVDEAIEKTQRLKNGLMHELLTKGIGHKDFKETEIGRIPKEWGVVAIEEISNVKRGASPRPIGDSSYFTNKGRGWIRISDVTDTYKYLRKTSQYLSKKEKNEV